MLHRITLSVGLALSVSFASTAMTKQELAISLKDNAPFNIESIEDSPIKGVYQMITDKGLIYAPHDGKHLIVGTIYKVSDPLVNLTKERKTKMNSDLLNEYQPTSISYPAKDEKYSISIFTDIDCGYCRKLHAQVEDYNKLGITLNFLAFPRSGLADPRTKRETSTYKRMKTVWCEDDQKTALTLAAENSSLISMDSTCVNPVEAHYNLGKTLGVKGTPAMFTSKATLISGYVEPQELLKRLDSGI